MASLPCAYCGIEGYSQHAHENDGKGARLKVDGRTLLGCLGCLKDSGLVREVGSLRFQRTSVSQPAIPKPKEAMPAPQKPEAKPAAPTSATEPPIFRDAGHALHVAFLIHSLPPTIKSPTAIVIDRLVKENHVWDDLPAPSPSSVNFSGLTPQEVRAQTAMVVAMVGHLPHPGEAAACKAIYGHQAIKADGVRGMAAYCAPALACQSKDYALYCAWHVFATKRQRDGLAMGDIAKQFGVSVAAVRESCQLIRRYSHSLLARALSALSERFEAGGLIAVEAFA